MLFKRLSVPYYLFLFVLKICKKSEKILKKMPKNVII